MNIKPRKLRRSSSRLSRAVVALGVAAGGVGVAASGSTTASADASVYALSSGAPMSYAPYVGSEYGGVAPGVSFSISCYLTGDNVTGQYGTENVWDLISTPYSQDGYVTGGMFVPDADVYTGSNSPVVPRCSSSTVAVGTIIGSGSVTVDNVPGGTRVASLNLNERVAIKCYEFTNYTVTGPYGPEKIWDQLWAGNGDDPFGTPGFIPDALLYTGSNSAVVPPC